LITFFDVYVIVSPSYVEFGEPLLVHEAGD
jgi:hypothetical protein